ncbi:hypothetical protein [Halorarius litoreus]|uniref:hypothetical protein n=1 Tax=Halorarius litoreus TaxID=2962676 RepID=UPI0020CF32A3|nr:hypothetical protein [Halorarius litoreus]
MTDGDELCERVADLEATVAELSDRLSGAVNRDIPLLKGTVRAVVDAEIDEIGELPDAGRAFNGQVATHGERLDAVEKQLAALGDIGATKTTKEEKLAAICMFAQNKQGGQSSTVAVTASEIQGCVGVSRRYAYDLIDEAAVELEGVRVREATDVQTASGVEHKKKALLVDCEAVHARLEL